MNYEEFKEENSKKLQDFIHANCFWAFGEEALKKKLDELGLTQEEFQKQYTDFLGGAIKKDKLAEYKKIRQEMDKNALEMMKSSKDFAVSAFEYEFGNFECFYADRWLEAIAAIGITLEQINKNKMLLDAYKIAKKKYWDYCIENGF